jgi:hypothetical protein
MPATKKKTTKRFLSLPALGFAAEYVRGSGFSSVEHVAEVETPDGPIHVFRAVRGGHPYEVQVARIYGDRLALGYSKLSQPNPRSSGGVELYDPRTEQLRAQRQAIYETSVLRELGLNGPFRHPRTGRRADRGVDPEMVRATVSRYMFAMGTGVQKRDSRVIAGTQDPTPKTVAESAARYEEPDHLLRNRQDYEETLGLARKSGFYRVTREPTKDGFGFFVWPLPPGQDLPIRTRTEAEASDVAARLSAEADPRQTGRWWKPPTVEYTAAELSYWLPPASAFRL